MQWYYGNNNTQFGPVEEFEIQQKLQSGELRETDMVWCEGMADWAPCSSVPEFTSLRSSAESFPPPAPPAGGTSVSPYAPPQVLTGSFPMPATSGLATGALVMGILGLIGGLLCFVGWVLSIGGVICGHLALKEINRSDGRLGGRGMAIAGLVTGYLGVAILAVSVMIVVFAVIGSSFR